jgi:hypothetical protein
MLGAFRVQDVKEAPHHRLNMELDDRSPKFIWAPVYSVLIGETLHSPTPSRAVGLMYEGAIGQPR